MKYTSARILISALIVPVSIGVAAPIEMPRRNGMGRNVSQEQVDPAPLVGASRVNVDSDYRLRAGDRVAFSVAEDRKGTAELVVMASGEVDTPYLGRFPVAGKTCAVAASELREALEKKYFKRATVTFALNQTGGMPLQMQSSIRVYFQGAVRSEGAREFAPDGGTTVSRAILMAGGFADFANRSKVQLIRRLPSGESKIIIVNVQDLLKGKNGADPVLQAEDMIRVPEKWLNF